MTCLTRRARACRARKGGGCASSAGVDAAHSAAARTSSLTEDSSAKPSRSKSTAECIKRNMASSLALARARFAQPRASSSPARARLDEHVIPNCCAACDCEATLQPGGARRTLAPLARGMRQDAPPIEMLAVGTRVCPRYVPAGSSWRASKRYSSWANRRRCRIQASRPARPRAPASRGNFGRSGGGARGQRRVPRPPRHFHSPEPSEGACELRHWLPQCVSPFLSPFPFASARPLRAGERLRRLVGVWGWRAPSLPLPFDGALFPLPKAFPVFSVRSYSFSATRKMASH